MIILKIRNNAGPGNQMFMYAKAYALAKKYGHKIRIVSEISGYSPRQNILQLFSLDKNIIKGFVRFDWTKNQYIYRLFRKIAFDYLLKIHTQISQQAKGSRIYQQEPELDSKKTYVIDGYWECHKYFDEYRYDLIRQFSPNYELPEEVKLLSERVKRENSVVFHIRKGDFQQFGRLINDDYYEKSYQMISEQIGDIKPFVLTEDDEIADRWEKKYNAERIFFNTPHKYLDEWYVMKCCRHHVIANSTYSWWSSYLSENNTKNKIVICPDEDTYLKAEKDNTSDMYFNYYPEGVICVGAD